MAKTSRSTIDKKTLSFFIIGFLGIVWGTTYIATKIAIQSVPVFMMTGIRELIGGLLLLVLAFIFEKPPRLHLPTILGQGIFGLGFFTGARGLMTLSVDFIPAGLAALVYSLIPIYVLFLNAFTGNFFINRPIIIGLLLGAIGMFSVFHESLKHVMNINHMIGIGVAFAGALSWALTSIIVKGKREVLPPIYRSSIQMLFGATGLWILSWANRETLIPEAIDMKIVLAILYLAIVGSVAGFLAYMYAIKYLPVARVTLYAYINPFVALFLGWLVLHEPLTLELLISFTITISGVFLVNWGYRLKKDL